jgi:cobalt/nickel transport system permease protein
MHIPDGFIDVPTAVTTGVVSLGAVAWSLRRAGKELGERSVPLLGVTAAFIFAAQMLNFPVAGGTSGHLLGAVLAAVLLGPWAACIVLTVVLAVQAIGMADGGITALGANVMNMAVLGGIVGYYLFRAFKALLPKKPGGYFASVAAASWLSVVLASAAASVELAQSGTVPLRVSLPAMISVHMVIGIGEALITTTVVGAVLLARPDLVRTFDYDLPARKQGESRAPKGIRRARTWGFVAAALVVALALAVFVSPFASSAPDGLERVAVDRGFAATAPQEPVWRFAPVSDYTFPGISSPAVATAVAGGVGTLMLFGLVFGLGRLLGRGRSPGRA